MTWVSITAFRFIWFEYRVQVNGIRDELSGCLGSLPQNTRQDNHGLLCDIAMDSGYYCVILREFGVGYLPLQRPRFPFGILAINEPADMIVVILESEGQIRGEAHRPCVDVGPDEHEGTLPYLCEFCGRRGDEAEPAISLCNCRVQQTDRKRPLFHVLMDLRDV